MFEQYVEVAAKIALQLLHFFVLFQKYFLRFSNSCTRMNLQSGRKWYKVVRDGADVVSVESFTGVWQITGDEDVHGRVQSHS
jgi:hypothetical protein